METPLIVVLAGGIGKRFVPLTVDKTMIPFAGKPVLQYTFEMLERVGAKNVLIATNAENQNWIENYKSGLTIKTKRQPEALGMGDAVLNLESEIGDQPVIIMNAGDIVEDSLLQKVIEQSQSAYAIVPGLKVKGNLPTGYLQIDGERVTAIIEKPKAGEEPSDLINLVFHYFSKPQEFILKIKAVTQHNDDQYEQAISELMKEHEFKYVSYEGPWQKLKFSHNILDMMNIFLNKLSASVSTSAVVSEKATIEGNVYIDEGAKISDFAVIKGPVYIGKNVIVGEHTLVRNSMIEEASVVGFGTEIARSYVGPRCMFHSNFIGDSILESDINPSFGTCTTNYRMDGKPVAVKLLDQKLETTKTKLGAIIAKGVFSGVNTVYLPGVTVGANARIYPGTIVHSAVEPNTTIKSYQEQKVVKE